MYIGCHYIFKVLHGEKKRDEVICMGDSIVRKIDRTVCR